MKNESWNDFPTNKEIKKWQKKDWKRIVDLAYNEWKKDTTKTIDEIAMKYTNNDEIVDFVYDADEEAILASCIANKERWQIFPHIYREPNEEQIHKMWEVTKRAIHTCLYIEIYKRAEHDGYDVSNQVISEYEIDQYNISKTEQNKTILKERPQDLGEER